MAFWRRAARETPAAPDPQEAERAWWRTLEPLGPFRQQVVACLRGDMGSPTRRFSPHDGDGLFDAFRRFVLAAEASASASLDPIGWSILAAGRLLSGDLSGADRIIDLLPEKPHATDHGAGKCLLMPARVIRGALPVPDDVGDPDRWTAGSPEQAMLGEWLAEYRHRLRWIEAEGEYRLAR